MFVLHVHDRPIAGMPYRLVEGLRDAGAEVHRVQLSPHRDRHMGFPAGADLSLAVTERWFETAQVIHCHGFAELERVHAWIPRKRRVVVTVHGDPYRDPPAIAPARVDVVHVVTPDLLPLYPGARFIPNFLLDRDLAGIRPSRNGGPPVLLRPVGHSGKSHQEFEYVAGRATAWEIRVQPGYSGGIHNSAMLGAKVEADVVWDHLHGYYGLTTLEAWALGACSITAVSPAVYDVVAAFFGATPPFLGSVDLDEIVALFDRWASDPVGLAADRQRCRNFWEDHWRQEQIVPHYLRLYEELIA